MAKELIETMELDWYKQEQKRLIEVDLDIRAKDYVQGVIDRGLEYEVININFGEVGMYLPRSTEAIQTARKLLDMLEDEVRAGKSQGCPQDSATPPRTTSLQEDRAESPAERKDEAIASIPQEQHNLKFEPIPKFKYDKKAEKSYDKLFFFESEDGRVMLSYANCKLYTTKAAVLRIPFPIPGGYKPLKDLVTSKRTAVRTYRKYLSEMDTGYPALPEEKGAASQREDELRKKAEVNRARWEKNGKKEMSARTKELRDGVVAKMTLGIGAER